MLIDHGICALYTINFKVQHFLWCLMQMTHLQLNDNIIFISSQYIRFEKAIFWNSNPRFYKCWIYIIYCIKLNSLFKPHSTFSFWKNFITDMMKKTAPLGYLTANWKGEKRDREIGFEITEVSHIAESVEKVFFEIFIFDFGMLFKNVMFYTILKYKWYSKIGR